MPRRLALPLLLACLLTSMIATEARAGGLRRGHGGKYVTYNGSTFGTYPSAPSRPAYTAPVTYQAPTAAPRGPVTYQAAPPVYYVVPRRSRTMYAPPMIGS